jgi:hypothetical protein
VTSPGAGPPGRIVELTTEVDGKDREA